MKRPQLFGLATALAADARAFGMVRGVVNKPAAERTVEVQVRSSEVLVARSNSDLGQIAAESAFQWPPCPNDAVTRTTSPAFPTLLI